MQFAHALSIDHDKKAGGGWAAGLEWPSYSWAMFHARQINRCILQYPHRRLIGVPAPDFRRSLVRRHHPGATQGGACRRTRGSADTHHAYRVSSHRCHPARRSSSGLVVALPTRHSSAAPAARLHTPVSSRDCTTLAGGPRVMTADKGSTEVWGWHPDQPSVWILEDTSINLPSVEHCP